MDNKVINSKETDEKSIPHVKIRSITILGMACNIFLSILKVLSGLILSSVALVADGIHSLSDLLTDIAVLVSSKAARRPPDENHQYGHGRYETFGSQLIGFTLLIIGAGICWSAAGSLIAQEKYFPGPVVVIVAVISLVLKEILFHLTRKVAIVTRSTSLYANAWHHRSDAFSSLTVIIGGLAGMAGFGYGDQMAGIVVGVMVMVIAVKLIFEGFKEMSEHAIDKTMVHRIQNVFEDHKEVYHWHNLRTRKIGAEIFLDVHIHVDPELTVRVSHELTEELEEKIRNSLQYPVNVLIHVEPCTRSELQQAIEDYETRE